ncbi:MAG: quinone-dependent dihydroorotate dehydrogenase [Rhodospirillaceae bacterium]
MIDLFPVVGPLLRRLDPESAHAVTLGLLRTGLTPSMAGADDPMLRMRLWGLDFPNPVGMAAGFDKNAEVIAPLFRLGFGAVEVGTVTPQPQPGNPRPRCFRLPEQQAMINRYGFNSHGHQALAARLAAYHYRYRRFRRPGVLGVNLGRNKDSADSVADSVADYVAGVYQLAALADYLVINVSSPNTPGLRTLQDRGPLTELLVRVLAARDDLCLKRPPPLLLKIAPDLADEDLAAVAEVGLAVGIDGMIVTNTTVSRSGVDHLPLAVEAGGLSGRPLFERSTRVLGSLYRLTAGKLPLVGVGGIASPADAYAKIRAGASLIQLYTALVYQGPQLVREIKRQLPEFLKRDGFTSLAESVGAESVGAGHFQAPG